MITRRYEILTLLLGLGNKRSVAHARTDIACFVLVRAPIVRSSQEVCGSCPTAGNTGSIFIDIPAHRLRPKIQEDYHLDDTLIHHRPPFQRTPAQAFDRSHTSVACDYRLSALQEIATYSARTSRASPSSFRHILRPTHVVSGPRSRPTRHSSQCLAGQRNPFRSQTACHPTAGRWRPDPQLVLTTLDFC
jgi:hypothetical protein